MKLRFILLLLALTVGCGYSNMGGNSALHMDALVPNSGIVGGAPFTLTVNGTGFNPSSVVFWNNSARTTMFITANQITAQIPASDLAMAGTVTVHVRATGGVYGGGTNSNSITFMVNP